MTPAEEQILRNQVAILGLLSMMMEDKPATDLRWRALVRGKQCLDETGLLLRLADEQGRTVHGYTP